LPHCATKYFGTAEFDEASVLEFPAGLPGFESERRFLPVTQPGHEPLIFLQSLQKLDLCFVALPVRTVEPEYQLELADTDLELLGLDASRQPALGSEILGLAILTIEDSGVTANLLAPIVVNLKNGRAVQAIAPVLPYSHRHPVRSAGTSC
jgi:flagellar assembly factor FliW